MPPRSAKMNRFIFGFQRRVWWPKCTPASRSSRMETTAMEFLSVVDGSVRRHHVGGTSRNGRHPRLRSTPGSRDRSGRSLAGSVRSLAWARGAAHHSRDPRCLGLRAGRRRSTKRSAGRPRSKGRKPPSFRATASSSRCGRATSSLPTWASADDGARWSGIALAHNVRSRDEVHGVIERARGTGPRSRVSPRRRSMAATQALRAISTGTRGRSRTDPGFGLDAGGNVVLPGS